MPGAFPDRRPVHHLGYFALAARRLGSAFRAQEKIQVAITRGTDHDRAYSLCYRDENGVCLGGRMRAVVCRGLR
jgi:hypothetical protein